MKHDYFFTKTTEALILLFKVFTIQIYLICIHVKGSEVTC